MHRVQQLAIAGILAGTLASAASAATISIDNFESYDPTVLPYINGIATAFNSTPWLRLGGAVQDNMYASSVAVDGAAAVLAGTHSGLVSAINLNTTGAQAIYMRNYSSPLVDFSGTNTVSVLAASNSLLPTNVQLLFFDAPIGDVTNTSYITSVPLVLLPGAAQTLTFGLNSTLMELSDPGSDSTAFATALTHVSAIGFRFSSATGANGAENVYLDNFVATLTPVPEPASLATLAVGGAMLGMRRRKA
ncbi:MAG: hypothetical protein JWM57_3911 [Phycisphaerales bacterium]|nr:hypothetical protein [Phycisphaerales bacterium]